MHHHAHSASYNRTTACTNKVLFVLVGCVMQHSSFLATWLCSVHLSMISLLRIVFYFSFVTCLCFVCYLAMFCLLLGYVLFVTCLGFICNSYLSVCFVCYLSMFRLLFVYVSLPIFLCFVCYPSDSMFYFLFVYISFLTCLCFDYYLSTATTTQIHQCAA